MIGSFEERLREFVLTELAGLLKAYAHDKQELETALYDLEVEEARMALGDWS